MDPEIAEFARSYQAFHEAMTQAAGGGQPRAHPARASTCRTSWACRWTRSSRSPSTSPPTRSIDVDLALEALLAEYGGKRRGISGPHRDHVETFTDFLTHSFGSFGLGPVAYERMATGPDSDRRVVALGLGEIRIDGVPLIWLQRTAVPRAGRVRYTLELLCPDRANR